jgi:hypothetical protein
VYAFLFEPRSGRRHAVRLAQSESVSGALVAYRFAQG